MRGEFVRLRAALQAKVKVKMVPGSAAGMTVLARKFHRRYRRNRQKAL